MKLKYLLISCALLTSCDLFKPSTPECYDESSITLVRQVIKNHFTDYLANLHTLYGITVGELNIQNIQVNPKYELSYSKDTETRTCSASYQFNKEGLKAFPLPLFFKGEKELVYTVTIVKDHKGNYNQLVQIINY